jgi:hypothetical protein
MEDGGMGEECMGELKATYTIAFSKPERKALSEPRRRLRDNIKMDLK